MCDRLVVRHLPILRETLGPPSCTLRTLPTPRFVPWVATRGTLRLATLPIHARCVLKHESDMALGITCILSQMEYTWTGLNTTCYSKFVLVTYRFLHSLTNDLPQRIRCTVPSYSHL